MFAFQARREPDNLRKSLNCCKVTKSYTNISLTRNGLNAKAAHGLRWLKDNVMQIGLQLTDKTLNLKVYGTQAPAYIHVELYT